VQALVKRPLPRASAISAPYWQGLKEGKLLIQHCMDCNTPRHYPRLVCSHCYSMKSRWVSAKGTGTIHSWTVCHHAYHPGFAPDLPYVLLTVDLTEGVRAMGRLRKGDPASVGIAQPVTVGFENGEDSFVLPVFDLASHSAIAP
jgi:uncharacterized protein